MILKLAKTCSNILKTLTNNPHYYIYIIYYIYAIKKTCIYLIKDLIIFLTSGDKKPVFLGFVNEGISIGVSSIIFSLVSLEIFSSKVKSSLKT